MLNSKHISSRIAWVAVFAVAAIFGRAPSQAEAVPPMKIESVPAAKAQAEPKAKSVEKAGESKVPLKQNKVEKKEKTGKAKVKTYDLIDFDGKRAMMKNPDGQQASVKISENGCKFSKGFLLLGPFCQMVKKKDKVLIQMKDKGSLSGYRFVEKCPSTHEFKMTNWTGPGTGECKKKSGGRKFYEKYDLSQMKGKKCSRGADSFGKQGWWCE